MLQDNKLFMCFHHNGYISNNNLFKPLLLNTYVASQYASYSFYSLLLKTNLCCNIYLLLILTISIHILAKFYDIMQNILLTNLTFAAKISSWTCAVYKGSPTPGGVSACASI